MLLVNTYLSFVGLLEIRTQRICRRVSIAWLNSEQEIKIGDVQRGSVTTSLMTSRAYLHTGARVGWLMQD